MGPSAAWACRPPSLVQQPTDRRRPSHHVSGGPGQGWRKSLPVPTRGRGRSGCGWGPRAFSWRAAATVGNGPLAGGHRGTAATSWSLDAAMRPVRGFFRDSRRLSERERAPGRHRMRVSATCGAEMNWRRITQGESLAPRTGHRAGLGRWATPGQRDRDRAGLRAARGCRGHRDSGCPAHGFHAAHRLGPGDRVWRRVRRCRAPRSRGLSLRDPAWPAARRGKVSCQAGPRRGRQ